MTRFYLNRKIQNLSYRGALALLMLAIALGRPVSNPLCAQAVKGSLSGTITDPSGGIVRGVTVTVTERNTNISRATVTNDNGYYAFSDLPAGIYQVTAEQPGFKKATRDDVEVIANSAVSVDSILQVGEIRESVFVMTRVPTNWVQGEKKLITKEQIMYLITKGELTEEKVAQLIKKYGIGFQATPSIIEELEQAGAGNMILEAVRENGQRADAGESPRVYKKEAATPNIIKENPRALALDSGFKPIKVGGNILQPRLIKRADPVYPALAKDARVSGTVIIQVTVDEEGLVKDIETVQWNPFLNEAAEEAVKQWVYTPTLLNGEPVPVIAMVTVSFTLR